MARVTPYFTGARLCGDEPHIRILFLRRSPTRADHHRRHGVGSGALVEIARILDNAIYIDNIYSHNSFRRSRAEKNTPKYGMTCDIGASGCCAVRLLSERAETQQTIHT
jgi:hypothetical protein